MNSIQNVFNVAKPVPCFLDCHIWSIKPVLCNNKTEVAKWGEEHKVNRERNHPSQKIQYAKLLLRYYCIMTGNLWLGFTTSCDILQGINKSKMASPGCSRNQLDLKIVGMNKLLQNASL